MKFNAVQTSINGTACSRGKLCDRLVDGLAVAEHDAAELVDRLAADEVGGHPRRCGDGVPHAVLLERADEVLEDDRLARPGAASHEGGDALVDDAVDDALLLGDQRREALLLAPLSSVEELADSVMASGRADQKPKKKAGG